MAGKDRGLSVLVVQMGVRCMVHAVVAALPQLWEYLIDPKVQQHASTCMKGGSSE